MKKKLHGQIIRDEDLPEFARNGRPTGCCNAKHPNASFLFCWLPAGHESEHHTAGLEDWEVSPKKKAKKKK